MMKTLFINEAQLNGIRQLGGLSDDIVDAIYNGETPLGDNGAFPKMENREFLEVVALKRLRELYDLYDGSDDSDDLLSELSNGLNQCQRLERPVRSELERIAHNFVTKIFDIPKEMVDMKLTLVDKVDEEEFSIIVDPDFGGEIDFSEIENDKLYDNVAKHRLLNCLSMGAGIKISEDIASYAEEVEEINPMLPDLYTKILFANNVLLFSKADIGINDKKKKQLGSVSVKIGNPDEKVMISACGVILPILICETIRGLMELFSAHGLPESKKLAQMIIGHSDFLKAEPWDMRFGPVLWEMFTDAAGDFNMKVLPYLYMNISQLNTGDFNNFFKHVFAGTRGGQEYMSGLLSKSKAEFDNETDDIDPIGQIGLNKSIISDDTGENDRL